MEKIKCPICKNINVIKKEKFNKYDWYFCSNCEAMFAWPLYQEEKLYENWYENIQDVYGYYNSINIVKKIGFFQNIFVFNKCYSYAILYLKKQYKKSFQKPVIFDIGCGTGNFLKQCNKNNFISIGCDISQTLISFLKQQKLLCFYGSYEQYPHNFPKPDAITAFEVLEHLTDPIKFLLGLKEKFPDTKIFLSVPHPKRYPIYISEDQME